MEQQPNEPDQIFFTFERMYLALEFRERLFESFPYLDCRLTRTTRLGKHEAKVVVESKRRDLCEQEIARINQIYKLCHPPRQTSSATHRQANHSANGVRKQETVEPPKHELLIPASFYRFVVSRDQREKFLGDLYEDIADLQREKRSRAYIRTYECWQATCALRNRLSGTVRWLVGLIVKYFLT